MNKFSQILFTILVFLIVIEVKAQSSQPSYAFDNFNTNMVRSGLDAVTTNKIKDLIANRDQALLEDKKFNEDQESKYPIAFQDEKTTSLYENQKFSKSLSEIITIEQFKKLFYPQLESRITRITNEKLLFFKKKYNLSQDQETKLKKVLFDNTVNEISVKEYYNYDPIVSRDNYAEEQLKSSIREHELIKSFGYFYSKNTKTDILIKKLQEANIDKERINRFLIAIQTQQERTVKHDKTWRENDAGSVIYFHDEGDAQYKIDMDFREEVSKILTMGEFKTIYLSQLQTRINREAQKEFATIKVAYKFTDLQFDEIQKLIQEKNTELVITEEYYKYSYALYQQKLRPVEYRYGKIIREAMEKFEYQNQLSNSPK